MSNTKHIVMFSLDPWHVTLGTSLEFGKASHGAIYLMYMSKLWILAILVGYGVYLVINNSADRLLI